MWGQRIQLDSFRKCEHRKREREGAGKAENNRNQEVQSMVLNAAKPIRLKMVKKNYLVKLTPKTTSVLQ